MIVINITVKSCYTRHPAITIVINFTENYSARTLISSDAFAVVVIEMDGL